MIAGAVLSITTIDCTQVAEFPQSSTAFQVRVMVLACGHDPPTVKSLKVTVGVPSQLSVAVAIPVVAGAVLEEH